ncbi:CR3L4 protein, partial [Poecile atricapillus]|nr:CR3L4 protein [Poecile atricapillus]
PRVPVIPAVRHCPRLCPGRAAACSALNQELRKKGHGADPRSRRSLLRQLQALVKETSNKPAQTGTCVLVRHLRDALGSPPAPLRGSRLPSLPQLLFLSLGLILLPSSSPFRGGGSRDGLGPTGVISRNILTRREPGAAGE